MMLDTSVNHGNGGAQIVAEIIQKEVHKRTLTTWKINDRSCAHSVVLVYDPSADHAEKYVISKESDTEYHIRAKTTRGLIYGAGRFMRCLELNYKQDYNQPFQATIRMRDDVTFPITSTPRYTWRGHQIAYRPKTHGYDAMTSEVMKQEILDQVLFGINVIEMIPPKLDDCQQSPHFLEPWTTRLRDMSAWCDDLNVKVSLWYPAFPGAQWQETYESLARFDILFIPGGDPGGREPAEFFKIAKEHLNVARHYFPDVELWVSSQFGLSASPDLAWVRKSASSAIECGNFGAEPNPPHAASYCARRPSTARSCASAPGRCGSGASRAARPMAAVSSAACARTSALASVQASPIRARRSRKPGMPCRDSGGK